MEALACIRFGKTCTFATVIHKKSVRVRNTLDRKIHMPSTRSFFARAGVGASVIILLCARDCAWVHIKSDRDTVETN